MHARNAQTCAQHGCVVIVPPIAATTLIVMTRALPSGYVVDGVLSELTGCIVMGSNQSCEDARKALEANS